ncbi:Transcriptional regulator, AraC family [Moritella sp. JT01]|uniref:AraC family transcriptional regulator n=1 Tax=Moritella sp. JT01 TaxID=756698 RepID=UPI000794BF68|nr:AraC family transcriptional regulator [Moritella sp. JT01]KXO13234.1 Transcriptional regulator, AraC family [Moritella sp. JT01]
MKTTIQKVPQRQGWSWRYKMLEEIYKSENWHAHQEFELVLHRNFKGKAVIGSYEGQIEHNDLILIGPNVVHSFESIDTDENNLCETHIIWFREEWIAKAMYSCVELRQLAPLLQRANKGLSFSPKTAEMVYKHLNNFESLSSIGQLAVLIQVLAELYADQSSLTLLSRSTDVKKNTTHHNNNKIDRVCQYIDNHFASDITLKKLANYMYVSENTIHRWFIQNFNESFSQYLKKLRLNYSAQLLTTTNLSISLIAEKVGYRNQANFNRLFKEYKHLTPSKYRLKFK